MASAPLRTRAATTADLPNLYRALSGIIDEVPLYNDRSKSSDHKIYTKKYLTELHRTDPELLLVGYCGSSLAAFAVCKFDQGPIWLSWFGAVPEYRGHGFGKKILANLLGGLRRRGVHKLWCDTRTNNKYAIKILKSLGFRKLCRMENHWYNQDYFLWEYRVSPLHVTTHEPNS